MEHGNGLRQASPANPLADKLLTTVAFIYMMRDGVCSPVVLCIDPAREFARVRPAHGGRRRQGRQGDRRQHVGQGEDRAADAEHHLLLLWHGVIALRTRWDATVMVVGTLVVLCWLVAAVTAISGIKYLWDNRSFINTAK